MRRCIVQVQRGERELCSKCRGEDLSVNAERRAEVADDHEGGLGEAVIDGQRVAIDCSCI
jgi:hypothetical protein